MPKQTDSYVREATIIRWVDGDTVWVKVDLGYRIYGEMDFRLYGINTPEKVQPNYQAAIDLVNGAAPVGTKVTLKSYKNPDKYGRWLAEIFVPGVDLSVNEQLLAAKLAVPYYGGAKSA